MQERLLARQVLRLVKTKTLESSKYGGSKRKTYKKQQNGSLEISGYEKGVQTDSFPYEICAVHVLIYTTFNFQEREISYGGRFVKIEILK